MSIVYGPLKIVKRTKKLWNFFYTFFKEEGRISILILDKSPDILNVQFAYIGDYRVHFRTFVIRKEFTDNEILDTFEYAYRVLFAVEHNWLQENQLPKRGKMDDYC